MMSILITAHKIQINQNERFLHVTVLFVTELLWYEVEVATDITPTNIIFFVYSQWQELYDTNASSKTQRVLLPFAVPWGR